MNTYIDCLECGRYKTILKKLAQHPDELRHALPAPLAERVARLSIAFPDAPLVDLVVTVITNTVIMNSRDLDTALSPPDIERVCNWLGQECSLYIEEALEDLHSPPLVA